MIDYQKMSEEYIKCYSDKSRIYMIESLLKTFDGTQKKEVPFNLFPKQKLLCQTLATGRSTVTTKYRQAGISTVTGAFISCEMVLADNETPQTALIIGNTLDLAQLMLFKIRDFLLQFPLWMWGNSQEFSDLGLDITKPPTNKNIIFDVCNGKEIRLKNGSRVVARSSGPDSSRGVSSVRYLIFDECAFIENAKDVYASALPTISVNGACILISTPNGYDSLYYETTRRAKLKGTPEWNGFELVQMYWYQDPRYNKFLEWTKKNPKTNEIEIIKEEVIDKKGSVPYDEDKWEKLVKDGWKPRSPWYINMCQQFNNDEQKIAQELDISFLGSDSTVVPSEYIKMQEELNVVDPQMKDNILEDFWIWKRPIEGHRYLLSVDNSRGSSDDSTAMEIIDMDGIDFDGKPCIEQVAEYNGKLTGDAVGELAYTYGLHYNQAFVIVEDIGGYGSATLLCLMNMKYPNLYYDDPSLKKFTLQTEATTLQVTENGLPGFHSSSVRFQMLSSFANMVKTNQFKIRSKRVINELYTWIFKNGRIDHKDGCHDDTLTCLAMGLFVMTYSINRKMEMKAKDGAMLKAIIQTNNRIVNFHGYQNKTDYGINKSFVPPIYVDKKNQSYQSHMWLLV